MRKYLILLLVVFSTSAFSKLDDKRYATHASTVSKCAFGVIMMKIKERGFGAGAVQLHVELDEDESSRLFDAYEAFDEQKKSELLFFDFKGKLIDEKINIQGSVAVLAQKVDKGVDCRMARHNQLPYPNQRSFKMLDQNHMIEMD